MKTFAQFLEAAKIELRASFEKMEADARQPLDEQIRLGNVAGPLLFKGKADKKALFAPVNGIPFDWGKIDPERDVVPIAPNAMLPKNARDTGKLSPPDSPRELLWRKSATAIETNSVCFFPQAPINFISRWIEILSAWDDGHSRWPSEPTACSQYHASSGKAREQALAACLDPQLPLIAIKGPPGTGKTDLLAEAAIELARQGRKIGIVSTSHAVVDNALLRIATRLDAETVPPDLAIQKHADKGPHHERIKIEKLKSSNPTPDIWGAVLVSANWLFNYADNRVQPGCKFGECDVLLVDEAGQIPAFEVAAMSPLAERMILFGDEDQLPNICHGQHPPGSHGDSSAMAYLRDVLPDHSLALEVSHRMNDQICQLIQHHFYPGIDLKAGLNAKSHLMENETPFPSLIKDAFKHPHPRLSRSETEAAKVVAWVKRLLGMQVVVDGQSARPMTPDDIAILTPFRAHAGAIKTALAAAKLPEIPRLGTVDKMQGQGAAAVIYSLASSSKDYIAGQTEWLLSANRWNVALSRAKACAIVLGDIDAHLTAVPKALNGIAAQTRVLNLLLDEAWKQY